MICWKFKASSLDECETIGIYSGTRCTVWPGFWRDQDFWATNAQCAAWCTYYGLLRAWWLGNMQYYSMPFFDRLNTYYIYVYSDVEDAKVWISGFPCMINMFVHHVIVQVRQTNQFTQPWCRLAHTQLSLKLSPSLKWANRNGIGHSREKGRGHQIEQYPCRGTDYRETVPEFATDLKIASFSLDSLRFMALPRSAWRATRARR